MALSFPIFLGTSLVWRWLTASTPMHAQSITFWSGSITLCPGQESTAVEAEVCTDPTHIALPTRTYFLSLHKVKHMHAKMNAHVCMCVCVCDLLAHFFYQWLILHCVVIIQCVYLFTSRRTLWSQVLANQNKLLYIFVCKFHMSSSFGLIWLNIKEHTPPGTCSRIMFSFVINCKLSK